MELQNTPLKVDLTSTQSQVSNSNSKREGDDLSLELRIKHLESLVSRHVVLQEVQGGYKVPVLNIASAKSLDELRQENQKLTSGVETLQKSNSDLAGRVVELEKASQPVKSTGYSTCCKATSIVVTLLVGVAGVAIANASVLLEQWSKYTKV